uniref:ShKT domain-containing protein n=1 Tax=Salvator merianae TaxID=96440 RepID=A0A8D0BHZ2_SALMN
MVCFLHATAPLPMPDSVKNEIVEKHNEIRRRVTPTASNMVKMIWSEKAAESAGKWARQCQPRNSPRNERILDGVPCGESRMQASYSSSWSDVIEMWHRKVSNFRYGSGAIDPKKDIYSYTQMVWYNSKDVGCAIAFCSDNTYNFFYVCQYCPAGNIVGEIPTPYKEGPPCGECPENCEDKLCTNPCMYKDLRADCLEMIKLFSCNEKYFEELCAASCKCSGRII